MTKITTEEWLATLDVAEASAGADGMTMQEVAEAIGRCSDTARKMVSRAIKEGRWEHSGWRRITRINGVPFQVPVYRAVRKGR